MGVDDEVSGVGVSRQMDLLDAVFGDVINKGFGVKPMVKATHVDVVNVEQKETIRLFGNGSECPFGHH